MKNRYPSVLSNLTCKTDCCSNFSTRVSCSGHFDLCCSSEGHFFNPDLQNRAPDLKNRAPDLKNRLGFSSRPSPRALSWASPGALGLLWARLGLWGFPGLSGAFSGFPGALGLYWGFPGVFSSSPEALGLSWAIWLLSWAILCFLELSWGSGALLGYLVLSRALLGLWSFPGALGLYIFSTPT